LLFRFAMFAWRAQNPMPYTGLILQRTRPLPLYGLQKFVDIGCYAFARSVDDDMVAPPRFVFPRNDFLPSR